MPTQLLEQETSLANGIIDYVAYFYFCPWFGIYSSVLYGVIKNMANLCIVVYLLLEYYLAYYYFLNRLK